jgi:hypothetical protein
MDFEFTKAHAEHFLKQIDKNGAIEPPSGKWDRDSILCLSGCCQYLAGKQSLLGVSDADQRLEAFEHIARASLQFSKFASQLHDGEYSGAPVEHFFSHTHGESETP